MTAGRGPPRPSICFARVRVPHGRTCHILWQCRGTTVVHGLRSSPRLCRPIPAARYDCEFRIARFRASSACLACAEFAVPSTIDQGVMQRCSGEQAFDATWRLGVTARGLLCKHATALVNVKWGWAVAPRTCTCYGALCGDVYRMLDASGSIDRRPAIARGSGSPPPSTARTECAPSSHSTRRHGTLSLR
jgi:hypothetical protein